MSKYYKAVAEVTTASNTKLRLDVGLFLAESHEHAHNRAYNSHFKLNMLPIIETLLEERHEEIFSVTMHTYIN